MKLLSNFLFALYRLFQAFILALVLVFGLSLAFNPVRLVIRDLSYFCFDLITGWGYQIELEDLTAAVLFALCLVVAVVILVSHKAIRARFQSAQAP